MASMIQTSIRWMIYRIIIIMMANLFERLVNTISAAIMSYFIDNILVVSWASVIMTTTDNLKLSLRQLYSDNEIIM